MTSSICPRTTYPCPPTGRTTEREIRDVRRPASAQSHVVPGKTARLYRRHDKWCIARTRVSRCCSGTIPTTEAAVLRAKLSGKISWKICGKIAADQILGSPPEAVLPSPPLLSPITRSAFPLSTDRSIPGISYVYLLLEAKLR